MTKDSTQLTERGRWRALYFLLPLAMFAIIAGFLGVGLTLNPREVPSPLIGRAVPEFDLPPVQGRSLGLSSRDLKGQVQIVNVFASWCAPCRQEHPLLLELQRAGLAPIHGLNYKDAPDEASRWLDRLGDPYKRTGADLQGKASIDWGVYGVPETFIIDREGRVAFKHVGPLTPEIVTQKIRPLITRLNPPGAT